MNNSPEDQTDQEEDACGDAAHEVHIDAGARARQKLSAQREERRRRRASKAGDGEEPEVAVRVGYGAPPVSTQFKPGMSGNPAGRPRGSKNKEPDAQKLRELILAVGDRRGEDGNGASRIEKVVAALHSRAEADDVAAMKLVLHLRAAAEASVEEEARKLEAGLRIDGKTVPPEARELMREAMRLIREDTGARRFPDHEGDP